MVHKQTRKYKVYSSKTNMTKRILEQRRNGRMPTKKKKKSFTTLLQQSQHSPEPANSPSLRNKEE